MRIRCINQTEENQPVVRNVSFSVDEANIGSEGQFKVGTGGG